MAFQAHHRRFLDSSPMLASHPVPNRYCQSLALPDPDEEMISDFDFSMDEDEPIWDPYIEDAMMTQMSFEEEFKEKLFEEVLRKVLMPKEGQPEMPSSSPKPELFGEPVDISEYLTEIPEATGFEDMDGIWINPPRPSPALYMEVLTQVRKERSLMKNGSETEARKLASLEDQLIKDILRQDPDFFGNLEEVKVEPTEVKVKEEPKETLEGFAEVLEVKKEPKMEEQTAKLAPIKLKMVKTESSTWTTSISTDAEKVNLKRKEVKSKAKERKSRSSPDLKDERKEAIVKLETIKEEPVSNAKKRSKKGKKDEGPVQCPICFKFFAKEFYFRQHTNSVHSDGLNYRCTCGKRFTTEVAYTTHKARHDSTDKPFKCTICTKQFQHRTDCNRHIAYRHTGNTRHNCPRCEKSFSRPDHLRQHLQAHDENRVRENRANEPAKIRRRNEEERLRKEKDSAEEAKKGKKKGKSDKEEDKENFDKSRKHDKEKECKKG